MGLKSQGAWRGLGGQGAGPHALTHQGTGLQSGWGRWKPKGTDSCSPLGHPGRAHPDTPAAAARTGRDCGAARGRAAVLATAGRRRPPAPFAPTTPRGGRSGVERDCLDAASLRREAQATFCSPRLGDSGQREGPAGVHAGPQGPPGPACSTRRTPRLTARPPPHPRPPRKRSPGWQLPRWGRPDHARGPHLKAPRWP